MRRTIFHRTTFFFLLGSCSIFSPSAFAVDTNEGTSAFAQRVYAPSFDQKESNDLAAKVIRAFNTEQCAPIASLVTEGQYDRLPAVVLAIAGYCAPGVAESESLFARAEAIDPTDDIVAILHARRLWKENPKAAVPFFQKAVSAARHEDITRMARLFLEGHGQDAPIALNPGWISFGSVRASVGNETNPQNLRLGNQTDPSSFASLQGTVGTIRSLSFGALAANYSISRYQYFLEPLDDLLQQDLEVPVILRAGANEDIRLVPYGEFQFLGSNPYYLYGGLRVTGVAYRGSYKQTVQAALFQDGYYNSTLERQAGSHFRFNYLWEFYPQNWFISFEAYIEHVQAGRLVSRPSGTSTDVLNVPYSHNDIVFRAAAEHGFRWVRLGLNLGFLLREDDLDTYYSLAAHVPGSRKRRQDVAFVVEPSATLPLGSQTQLFASYRLLRLISNMGPGDYQNLNFTNDIVTLGMRIFFESL